MIVLLVVLLLAVAFLEWEFLFCLLGLSRKSEVLKYLGISVAGLLLMLQAVIANRRAKAMQQASEAHVEANRHTEDGQRQERLKNAIEHLGHERSSVRMGGAYELFHLARDTPHQLGQTILDILCAHIRAQTSEAVYLKHHEREPSVEIQGLLNLLFRQNYEEFRGGIIDLKGSWLKGSELREAHLSEAILAGVQLQGADLEGAQLQGADFLRAELQGANLHQAQLQGADLEEARMQETDLQEAALQGANLQKAWLQGAKLQGTWLQGASLEEAQLQGANLQEAQLQGVRPLLERDPAESDLSKRGHFEERMTSGVGVGTNLTGVTFDGGLAEKDMDDILHGLPGVTATKLADKLRMHVGKPASYQLPAGSGAATGAYDSEDARKWIAEYPERPSPNRVSGVQRRRVVDE